MKLPFGKKKTSTEADAETGEKKKKFRFVISIKQLFQRKAKTGAGLDGEDAKPVKEKKPKKPKKEKKPKVKKEKPKKVKRKKGDGSKKKTPVLLFVAIGGVVVVGAGVAAFLLLRGGPSVESQLEKAAQHTAEESYDEAQEIYDKLLEEDVLLVEAYLGSADNYLAQERLDDAIFTLETGYIAVEDPRIAEKLKEIRPASEGSAEPTVSEEPIVWKDSALEKMVRQALALPAATPISEADLQDIRELKLVGGTHAATNEVITTLNSAEGYTIGGTLYTERGDIRTLDDLVYFKNLRKLTVCYNQVTDISGIAGLTGLDTVGLYFNNIADITPLASLPNLQYLYLYNNDIQSIAALSELSMLRSVSLQNNRIADVSPLKGKANLTELYLNNNQVADISALTGMKSLAFLYADNNQITDIAAVAAMPKLTDVSFAGNPVTDYTPAANVQKVRR